MQRIILACTLLAAHTLYGETMDQVDTFLLPLDATSNVGLSVKIPKGFKPIQTVDQFSNPDEVTIEFIPTNESPEEWSEIITVNKFIGKGIHAQQFSDFLADQIQENSEEGKILSKSASKDGSVEQASFIMSYKNQNRQEVIGAFYFSGPYDAAGAQYTMVVKEGQMDKAISKIKAFFDQNLQPFKE